MDLVNAVFTKNNQAMTDSKKVAEYFEKEHYNVLRDIKEMEIDKVYRELNFEGGSYPDSQGQERPLVYMTRNGFMLLVMGFTGKKAMDVKIKFLEAFDNMEKALRNVSVVSRTHHEVAEGALGAYLRMADMLGAPKSLARAMAVQCIAREYNVNIKGLVLANVSDIQELLLNPTPLGLEYGLSAEKFNRVLEEFGLQKSYRIKDKKYWELTDLGIQNGGVYLDTGKEHSNNTIIQQVRWYKDTLMKFLDSRGMKRKVKDDTVK